MKDLSIKQNVLQEIMDLMDARDGEDLKSHPKLMAAKIEVKPEGDSKSPIEGSDLEESLESPEVEKSEGDDGEISPEDLQALLEKFKGLK
jgi:hypothetical protein